MNPIILVENLTKKYRARTVVDQLSFSVAEGQFLGLLGPNGAGKTTTMRMLMGLTKPTSGVAQIFGYDVTKESKKIHAQIGVVFEQPNLFENLSGYQNLALYCRLYGRTPGRIPALLERMGLADRAGEPVKIYSKGMRQRIMILRSLIHQPRLLFLDEPASGLDPVSSRIIWDYLKEEKAGGLSVVLTSHDMEEVDELCDRIGFINYGQLITLSDPGILKKTYGRPLLKVTYCRDGQTVEQYLAPDPPGLEELRRLYGVEKIISLHSQEATLSEIFLHLSSLK